MKVGAPSFATFLLIGLASASNAQSPSPEIIEAAKAVILGRLKDPESARFSDFKLAQGGTLLCGYVNAKNSHGGYVGKKQFRYVIEKNVAIIVGGSDISTDILDTIYPSNDTCKD